MGPEALAHARNLASFQRRLATTGGWRLHERPGLVAADAGRGSRFLSSAVVVTGEPDPGAAADVLALGFWASGADGTVLWDMAGRPGVGEVRTPLLMAREPGPLPVDPRVVRVDTAERLRWALHASLDMAEGPAFGADLLAEDVVAAAVLQQGAPVALAVAHDDGDTVGVYLVGTAPAARRQGLAGAVTAAVVAALPPRPALLTATELGEPVYRRLGFAPVHRATMHLRERRPA